MIFILAGSSFRRIAPRLRLRVGVSVVLLASWAALIVTGISQPLHLQQSHFGIPRVSVVIARAISAGLVQLVHWVIASITPGVARVVVGAAAVGLAVVLTHSTFILLPSKLQSTYQRSRYSLSLTAVMASAQEKKHGVVVKRLETRQGAVWLSVEATDVSAYRRQRL